MMTRRRFLATTALASGAALAPMSLANAAGRSLRLTAYINGKTVERGAVLEWEARRIKVAADRLAQHLPSALVGELNALLRLSKPNVATIDRDRNALADAKMRLGEAPIRRLLSTDLALSNPVTKVAATPKLWAISQTDLVSSLGTAKGFVDWFLRRVDANDERAMLVACPDHYLLRTQSHGIQEVIEVTGGAVIASRFVINLADTAGVPIPNDAAYPIRATGWARGDNGVKIGSINHQFRDNPKGGFSAKLAVAFPGTLPPWMIAEHRWHLACEWSNWVTAYVASTRT